MKTLIMISSIFITFNAYAWDYSSFYGSTNDANSQHSIDQFNNHQQRQMDEYNRHNENFYQQQQMEYQMDQKIQESEFRMKRGW